MNLTQRLRHAFRDRTVERNERYLAQATSLVDLEWRQRELDRGRVPSRNFG